MPDSRSASSDKVLSALREFMQLESASGLLLLAAAALAMLIANSPLTALYDSLLSTTVAVQVGALIINKPLLLWINDGLMAVFFFLIGLEIKREVMEGELSSVSQVVLPAMGAFGGMLVPAGIYVAFNYSDPEALGGWAIPMATDIAFALALLGTFGSRVPTALKVFLLTLAIFDDLAAIVVIALFYSGDLSLLALITSAVALGSALAMNRLGVTRVSAYVLIGVVLWVAVLKSGVHATLAGVLVALCVPMRDTDGGSPLRELEHDLHGPVAFAILPIFAFANAGLSLSGLSIDTVLHPVTMGIVAGLVLGKPLGIMLFVGLAVALRMANLPAKVNWPQLLGISFACGIGFTMSLFIAGLAFEHGGGQYYGGDRLGILLGSVIAAGACYVLLHLSLPAAKITLKNTDQ
ncbi:Na+/H+ antiporter NhaA [Woeseia oceani]|uniref:Na(+)/H(+) antiporter NhaA n=1 Tax=Woeseia oceani TaxID=1548547 RepID=A0A193LE96_9GAMM|nr:Na+/H+ antiporter NhaA [Woeseia oceani]ANO50855.1 Na(+)/H(+) antiporter NhaA [Woeseia oceani]